MTGQKVVCIDDKFPLEVSKFYIALPQEGKVYVIRNVELGCNWKGEAGEVCLLLIGLHNPKSSTPPFRERGFNAERFRPLEELTTEEHQEAADCIAA